MYIVPICQALELQMVKKNHEAVNGMGYPVFKQTHIILEQPAVTHSQIQHHLAVTHTIVMPLSPQIQPDAQKLLKPRETLGPYLLYQQLQPCLNFRDNHGLKSHRRQPIHFKKMQKCLWITLPSWNKAEYPTCLRTCSVANLIYVYLCYIVLARITPFPKT